uniref:Uncharacterized protein n=1 Tax=uncultured Coleofasciculus sp. TaxID=1267456 RepID=A0A6J4JXF8_9CYAN|nr:hypothetical protein AVDCRST_MAG92-4234 [uncultured Coleofasciculus sp.]
MSMIWQWHLSLALNLEDNGVATWSSVLSLIRSFYLEDLKRQPYPKQQQPNGCVQRRQVNLHSPTSNELLSVATQLLDSDLLC